MSNYDYSLPSDRIPDYPSVDRGGSKLLVSNGSRIQDAQFTEIVSHLSANDLLIFNDTRVIRARMHFHKSSGAKIEIFLLEPASPADYQLNFENTESVDWYCMVGNARKWKEGSLMQKLIVGDRTIEIKAEQLDSSEGKFRIQFTWNGGMSFAEILNALGEIPLPPYINRKTEESDRDRYQTVFAEQKGSVAAPTAGLHFTNSILNEIRDKGVLTQALTLHVGAGTFKPVSGNSIDTHEMHSERFIINRRLIEQLKLNRRIIAVGTTSVRTLESIYYLAYELKKETPEFHIDQWTPYTDLPKLESLEAIEIIEKYMNEHNLEELEASTSIMIVPGYEFHFVNALITNFHLPKSTLLLLVSALIGSQWEKVYTHALENDYRFLSYGDSSFLVP